MGENKENAERMHEGLSVNLYQFQSQFKELPPNSHLKSGEVKKVGEFPVQGTATMDIYEGLYLGREKVAIKAIRSMRFTEQSKRVSAFDYEMASFTVTNHIQRFKREAEIWQKIWHRDHGVHIVPFYGYCQIDGPFPYVMSISFLTYISRFLQLHGEPMAEKR